MAQLVRAPPCHGGGREFESHLGRLEVDGELQAFCWLHAFEVETPRAAVAE